MRILILICILLRGDVLLGQIIAPNPSSNSDSTSVTLFTRASSSAIFITCDVESSHLDSRFNVHLFCPLTSNQKCYRNCTASTLLPAVTDCQCTQLTTTHIQYVYTIDLNQINDSGQWLCSYKGVKSNEVRIAAAQKTSSTSTTTRKPTTVSAKTTSLTTLQVVKTSKVPDERNEKPGERDVAEKASKEDFANPQLVFVLLILLLTSVLVNVGFCIQCILVRNYIEKVRSGERTDRCIERCLCLDPDPRRLFWKMYNKESVFFRESTARQAALVSTSPPESPRYHRLLYIQRPSLQGEMFHEAPTPYVRLPSQNAYSPMTELVDHSGSNSVQLLYHPVCNTFPRAPHQILLNHGTPTQNRHPMFHQSWDGNPGLSGEAKKSSSSSEAKPHVPSPQPVFYDDVPFENLSATNANPLYARVQHANAMSNASTRPIGFENYVNRARRAHVPVPDVYGHIVMQPQLNGAQNHAIPSFDEEFENVENGPFHEASSTRVHGNEYEQVIVGSASGLPSSFSRNKNPNSEPVDALSPNSPLLSKATIT